MNFEEKVLAAIREYKMIPDGTRVLVGVSGGADSVCLLAVLEKLRRAGRLGDGVQLRAVHVHHGLRRTADRDEHFVRSLCGRCGIPLAVYHVDAAAEASRRGMGLEEAGRALRREAFLAECSAWGAGWGESAQASGEAGWSGSTQSSGKSGWNESAQSPGETGAADPAGNTQSPCRAALAHHLEDSAETLLFNLCRGSSAAGLAGIRPVSMPDGSEDNPYVPIIRPLIQVSRSEIEGWLLQEGLTWCTDETNADTRFTRNYLRGEILPALEEHVNAKAARHMARAALELSAAEEYLQEETARRLSECRITAGQAAPAGVSRTSCSVRKLRELPLYWRRRALYRAMTELVPAKDLGDAHIEALLRLLETTGSAQLDLPYGLSAKKEYDVLSFVPAGPEQKEPPSQPAGRRNETPRTLLFCESVPESSAPADAAETGEEDSAEADPARAGAPLPLSADCYRTRILSYAEGMEIPAGPCTKWVDYDTITQSLSFRTRREGDVIALGFTQDGAPLDKRLSRVMIDRKIPKRLRESIVLPMDGQRVIWFPGYRIGADFRITQATHTVLELQLITDSDEEG